MKPYSLYIFIFLAVFCISCIQEFVSKLPHEPEDPDTYDMSVWEELEPGIHSGFGSIDIAYPKSIPPSGDIEKSIKLHGWKGERVNCKLLVWSANADEQVSIDLQEFNSDDLSIGNKQISISVIKYVLTDEFLNERSTACGPRDNDKIPAHLQADILSHENVFIAEGRGTRPVWISIDIPSDAIPGIYESVVSRKSPSGRERHLITLEVQDKLLPPSSEWSFHLDLWQNPFAVARYNGVELWSEEHFELLKPLLGKLADAGQKCITTTLIDKPWGDNKPCYDDFRSMIRWTRKKDGSWEYDYSIFDKYVRLAMACGIKEQINCYSMVPIHNKFTWYDEKSADTIIMEAFPGTEDYEMIWTGFLSDFRDHLDEMGWLDKTTIALDEREEEEMKDLFSFLKETAPEFKIAMAGFYYEALNPSIYDFSSNWRHTGIMSDGVIDSRRSSDLKTTYYVACGIPEPNSFTFSPPAESCYVGWFAAAEGFDGFLRWAYNSWPEEPLVDSRYTKWPAGDTYLIYPGARSSVRFERMREGIQDYEKIMILRDELARDPSEEAAAELKRLNDFLGSLDNKSLDAKSAAESINEGKQIIYEIVNNQYRNMSLL